MLLSDMNLSSVRSPFRSYPSSGSSFGTTAAAASTPPFYSSQGALPPYHPAMSMSMFGASRFSEMQEAAASVAVSHRAFNGSATGAVGLGGTSVGSTDYPSNGATSAAAPMFSDMSRLSQSSTSIGQGLTNTATRNELPGLKLPVFPDVQYVPPSGATKIATPEKVNSSILPVNLSTSPTSRATTTNRLSAESNDGETRLEIADISHVSHKASAETAFVNGGHSDVSSPQRNGHTASYNMYGSAEGGGAREERTPVKGDGAGISPAVASTGGTAASTKDPLQSSLHCTDSNSSVTGSSPNSSSSAGISPHLPYENGQHPSVGSNGPVQQPHPLRLTSNTMQVQYGRGGVPLKKRPHPVPDEKKDTTYWDRRKKNNESAKRSRDARRMKEEQIAMRVVYLEQENLQLRTEVSLLRGEIEKLRCMVYQS